MTHEEYTASLRLLADWYDKHHEVDLPYDTVLNIYGANTDSKEGMAKIARSFGTCEKKHDPTFFSLVKTFGSIKLQAMAYTSAICEKVQVGTETVEKQVPSEFITVTTEEPIFEWKCPGSLLAPEGE